MSLYSAEAPPARPFSDDKPTVLVAWWIAGLCAVVVAFRLMGRWIRVEKFFVEDKIAAGFLLPLAIRTAVAHVVLVYGTNNVLIEDPVQFSDAELHRRALGSGLVLLGRIFHAATYVHQNQVWGFVDKHQMLTGAGCGRSSSSTSSSLAGWWRARSAT